MPEKASYNGTLPGGRPSSRGDFGVMAIFRQLSLSLGYKIESMHHDNGQLRKTAEDRFVSEPSPVIEGRFQGSRSAVRACSLSLCSNRMVAPMVSKATRISARTRRRYGKSKEGSSEGAK